MLLMEAANIEQLQRTAERNAREEVTAFIRIAKVREISGLSKSTLLRWIKAGKFCAPVIQDGNSVLWDLAEVMEWRRLQFAKRDQRVEAAAAQPEAGA